MQLLVAPLAGVGVEERGAVHLAHRTVPVLGEGERGPAGLRTQLFLADVMGPAAAGLADAAAHHQQVDDAAVGHVHVVPVIQRGADDDHALAFGLVGVFGELARHGDHVGRLDAGVLDLPGRRVRHVVVVAGGDVAAAEATVDAVVGQGQVEYGGHGGGAAIGQQQFFDRHAARQHVVGVAAAEVGEGDFLDRIAAADQRQQRIDGVAAGAFPLFEVPAARLAPAKADRTARCADGAAILVDDQRFPFRIVGLVEVIGQVRGAQEVVRHQCAVLFHQRDQHREVGVLLDVAAEVVRAAVGVKLLEHHVAHRHRQRGIGALLRRQPDIAELGHFAEVGRHRHGLGALVAHFGVEVGVGGARHRHVRAPHHQEGGVVPVGRFGHVGLLAPHLRAGWRQVAVPVVERQRDAADQRQVAGSGRVAHHRHGRNRGKPDDAVGSIFLDREGVGGGDDLIDLVPLGAHEAAQAADRLVRFGTHRILADVIPCRDRVHGQARLAPHLHQAPAHHRVLDALGRIHVPRIAGATRAAARLVVGQVRAGARVVGLLGLPGDQPVLDIHLPAARTGAVDAVGRADDLVVLPALAIGVFPGTVLVHHGAVAVGKRLLRVVEEFQAIQKMTHAASTA